MNSGPADIDLVRTGPEGSGAPVRDRRPFVILALAAILLLVLAGAYLVRRQQRSEGAAAARPKPDAVKVQKELAEVPLPPLENTDALVRQLVGALSSHPVVAAWLATDRLIVNFVVVTSRIAEGQTPAAELKMIGPVGPFEPRAWQGGLVMDPSSYRRYDRYAQAVAAIDARGAVRAYETLKPRVVEAEKNFGGSGDFDRQLERAIVELLKVPVVEGQVALEMNGIGYRFEDPRLEAMSAAQKQLFRMGPRNVRAIQGKLREVASFLAIPASRLPGPITLD